MATVSLLVTTPDTGATPNTSGAYAPTAGRLQLVIVSSRQSGDNAPTLTNTEGMTYTKVTEGSYPGTPDNYIFLFVADALTVSGASQTVEFNQPADGSTGTIITVLEVDVTRFGLDAILQIATPDNDNSSGATPNVAFDAAVQTDNPTIAAMMNNVNPATITEPTDWTELVDNGHATPDHGQQVSIRNSGYTGTTITWGSLYGAAGAAIAVEINASAAGLTISPNLAAMSV